MLYLAVHGCTNANVKLASQTHIADLFDESARPSTDHKMPEGPIELRLAVGYRWWLAGKTNDPVEPKV